MLSLTVLLKILAALVGISVLVVLIGAACIGFDGLHDQIVNSDLAIVPGNPVRYDGRPSRRLQGRLDAALRLYESGRCKLILVSGSIEPSGIDEAQAMKAYLVSRGVPSGSIITDDTGTNTFETARFAADLIRSRGLGNPILVSQFFHISRFRLAMRKNGITSAGHAHSLYFERRDLYFLMREVVAYLAYVFR